MAGDAGESSEDGVQSIPHSWIPSVSDLKLAAGFSEKEKEEEAPLFPSLLYRFCDHDELYKCMWRGKRKGEQLLSRQEHARDLAAHVVNKNI